MERVPFDSEAGDPSIPESSTESHSGASPPLRVLLVGDGTSMPKIEQRMADGIDQGRYVVDHVETLADAFGGILNGEHDVYVVDHYVGPRTGFDLLARINEEGLRVPVVFVVGSSDHGTGVTAVAAGAACYIVEDQIDSDLLEQSLIQAVAQRTALSQLTEAGVAIDGAPPTKAQILSHIAERLRNPAAEILDYARDSLMYALPAHTVEALASIEDQANGLLTLANDLVDLSMLEAGHLEFASAQFSLRGLVANVKRLLETTTKGRAIQIVDSVADDVPDVITGDPGRLRRIIARFAESVIERTASDRILLDVWVAERNTTTVTLHFAVHPADHVPVDGSDDHSSPAEERMALGMPVVLETLSRMGGRIALSEEERRSDGIQFIIRLEMAAAKAEAAQPVIARAAAERPILVLADSVSDRRSMLKTLSEANLPHVVASTVDDWMEMRESSIDNPVMPALAVIDSTHDSFAEADRFIQRSPELIPIVVVAASGRRGDAARCRHHGISGYLAKPMGDNDLVDVVVSTLGLAASGDTTTLVTRHWLRDGRPSLRVLVVDDSQTNRFLMTRMLEERGHSTTTACDGIEAVEMIDRARFDVVLMDVMMPGMDGLEATRLISERNEPPIRPLIIGVSAFTDDTSQDRGREAGMATFLAKPIRPDDLFAAVEQGHPVPDNSESKPEPEAASAGS
jgi:two-component system sensor histidine kinase/response regulator